MNKKYSGYLFLTLFLSMISLQILQAKTHPIFKQLTTREGLSHNGVNTIVQDKMGYMWFGSLDGLNRFDGYNFKIYKSLPNDSNSISHNLVKSISLDKKGGMWIGTARGLNYFNMATNKFTRYYAGNKSGLSHDNIEMVYCDSRGRVWVATMGGGLNRFNENTNQFIQYRANENQSGNLSNDNVHWVFEDSKQRIWVGTEGGGVNLLNESNGAALFDYYQFEPKDGNYQALHCVRAIEEDDNGKIWVGTWGGGAAWLNEESGKFNYYRKRHSGITDGRVLTILSTSNGNLLLGTENGGLNQFIQSKQQFEQLGDADHLPFNLGSKNIKFIYEDQQQRIWIATSAAGVYSFQLGEPAISALSCDKLKSKDVYAIEKDDKRLWIGTNGGGLYYSNKPGGGFSDNNFQELVLESDMVHSLCVDQKQRLWAGTLGAGLYLIDWKDDKPYIQNFTIQGKASHSISYNDIRTLFCDSKGTIWVGTAGGGLDRIETDVNDKLVFYHYRYSKGNENALSNNDVRAIAEGKDGTIWVGTSLGLNRLNIKNNRFDIKKYFSGKNGISGNWINSLFADEKGLIWIGTDAGLNCLNPTTDSIKVYTEKDGLANNVVRSIRADLEGNIWISTVNGLSLLNPQLEQFYNFNEQDGLLGNEFNTNAVKQLNNGIILLGNTKGVNQLNPADALKINKVNGLHISNFKLFNQSVHAGEVVNKRVLLEKDISYTEKLHLKPNENSFSFEFAALDYSNAEKVNYQYKMEGFDKEWQQTSSQYRFATYTNLSGGDYVFRVRSNTGIPNDRISELSLNIEIEYPIWQRWWAFLFYFLVVSLIIYGILKYYRNKVRIQEELKMSERQRAQEQELILMKQRFFMNISHELKTPLTLIAGPVEHVLNDMRLSAESRSLLQLMKRNVNSLSRLISHLMDFSKQERGVLKLKVESTPVISYTEAMGDAFKFHAEQRGIEFNINCPSQEVYGWIDRDKMEKILFNLLSNAFKYTPKYGNVDLNIELESENQLIITVCDSGKGISEEDQKNLFNRFFQTEQSDAETGTGIGLSLVKELVTLHHGVIKVDSELGKGSCFEVKIPIQETAFTDLEKAKFSSTIVKEEESSEISIPSERDHITKLLVVEDNLDLCQYLKVLLSCRYEVIIANDGVEGLEKAKELMPDLILSDVMMPKMDGITFCKTIKEDVLLSHVPIILLTAKSGKENTLAGFNQGADDYVTKPFDNEILLARINALLESRKRIKDKLQQNPVIEVENGHMSQLDRNLLEKIEKIVCEQMASPTFSVEELGKQIGMSRSTLYRKIKGVTGQTAISYVRTIRLNEARKLISNGNTNIPMVAEQVGFTDIDYFRKCYKKQFKRAPEEE
ncbi:hybrid sensor histidine kinase/response regulator [Prolixibacteraceae bacterium JC049]|nr:hybrid sensor histidine kinase/response regulator [Prolixibacteraceae bacterium JC049]